jgi:uncharacterized repeat protein (TIGR01451 family)
VRQRFAGTLGALLFALCVASAPARAQVFLGGTLDQFGVLAGTGVSNFGATTVVRSIGVSPGSSVTGFPPGVLVGGAIHANDATAAEAQTQLASAYDAAAGTPCDVDLSGQDLGGLTLTPGVYCFSGGAQLTGGLTLDLQGNPDAFFLFQVGGSLATASGSSVALSNAEGEGCAPNLFWRVGSSAILGSGASFGGSILAENSVILATGASLSGRALARVGNVELDTNTITPCSRTADLSVTGTDSPDPVAAGQNVTYDITATNDGPDPARGAVLTVTLPSSLRLQSFTSAAGWSCSTPAVGSSGAVTCSKQSAAVGSAAFTLTAQVDPGITADTVSLPLEVSAPTSDPDTADRSTTLTTQVLVPVANLAVTLADAPDPVAAGENLVYTADVTNNGPDPASDVTLKDTLPAGVTFVSATPSQGTCMYATALNCSLGALANGAKARVTIVVEVASAASGSTIANSVSVTSPVKDTDVSDSTAGTGTLVATPTPPSQPTVSIVQRLIPATDPGRFDLKVGAVTVAARAGNGGGGSAKVPSGSSAEVAWSAASGTPGRNYGMSIDCGGDGKASGSSIRLADITKDVSCVATSVRHARVRIKHATVVAHGRRVKVALQCVGAFPAHCRGTLTLQATRLSSRKGGARKAAVKRFDVRAGALRRLRVPLPAATLKRLAKKRRAVVRAVVRGVGNGTTVRRLLTVVPAHSRRK